MYRSTLHLCSNQTDTGKRESKGDKGEKRPKAVQEGNSLRNHSPAQSRDVEGLLGGSTDFDERRVSFLDGH